MQKLELSTGLEEILGELTGVRMVSSVLECIRKIYSSKMTALGVYLQFKIEGIS